ncbi:MAG: hypothetical protein CVU09_01275 [Bacteroidetes bacterium HGW-Bacteroidetes-4]|jgi:hypothetical protein|nr:MAG: hypothetical protein CVU09_01275 [Bacteroidetes bacterium HGW-Bacteroidetes-4]
MGVQKKYNPFKARFNKLFLRSYTNDTEREVTITPLNKVQSVGVTFVVTNPKELETVKKVIKQIAKRGLNTFALGYIPEKKPNDFYLSEKTINFFYDKELDWLLRPDSDATLEFQQRHFDILIDLGSVEYPPMHYLLYKSKAKFKVGWFTNQEKSPFDLMINMAPEEGCESFISQVLHYLDKFN